MNMTDVMNKVKSGCVSAKNWCVDFYTNRPKWMVALACFVLGWLIGKVI